MGQKFSRICGTAFLSLWSLVAFGTGPVRAESGIQEYGKALAQYFRSLNSGLEPFVAPEGQQVGDVIDIKTRAVLKRRTVCFPGLTPAKPEPFELPRFVGLSEQAGSFFFGLKKLVGLGADVKFVDQVSLVYTQSTIETVTLDEFQSALSKDCEFLRPLIEQARPVRLYGRNATIVGAVVRARAITVMTFGGEMGMEANVEELGKLLPGGAGSLIPLDASLKAKMGTSGSKSVGLDSDGVTAVAFRPTHIPKHFLGPEPADGLIVFDPDNSTQLEIQGREIDKWISELK